MKAALKKAAARNPRVDNLRTRWLLSRTEPVSRQWGSDRGKPIDRLYIDTFISKHAADIRGHVLEIGADDYSSKFAPQPPERIEVFDVVPAPKATIISDLAAAGVADESFDCLIVLQTLMMVHDIGAAVDTIHRILKPGGHALVTVNFLAPNCDDACQDMWQWGISPGAAQKLFADRFGTANTEVTPYGNYAAAAGLLAGLSLNDIDESALWGHEPGYEVLVAVRATKSLTPKR